MKSILTIMLLLLALHIAPKSMAQGQNKAQKEARLLLDQAKEQMAAADFQAANRSFRQMLELKTSLPTEMCYYFASTLYMLGQYENSLRFAEKYETLAGVGGEFYQDIQKLKDLLKKESETILSCQLCDPKGYVLTACHYCESQGQLKESCRKCYGNKNIKCKTCEGQGVVIVKNHFGQNTYKTCTICQGTGFQACPFCDGSGEKIQDCQYCSGSGKLASSEICTHPKAHQPHSHE